MLRATLFPPPYNSLPILTRGVAAQSITCHSLQPARALHAATSLVPRFEFHFQRFRRPRVSLRAARGATNVPKRRRRGGKRRNDEFEFSDDDDDDYEEEEDDVVYSGDEYGEDDGDVEDEGMLPLDQMRKWFKKKPRGFGEGKVYDTSVEEKLLDEIRQSREAQAANLLKLKSVPVKSNNTDQNKKDSQVVPIGGRVRLVNLPKKKNIHRDLKVAFEGIPGIVNIAPAVTGNKKTRDPVCKGFAFVDFKHKADAVRFVELYSGQSITFGKIQKQISCELVNTNSSSSSASPKSKENFNAAPPLMVSAAAEEDSNEESNMDGSAFGSWDEATSDDSDDTENQIYEEEEDEEDNIVEDQDSATALTVDDDDDSAEMRIESEFNSLSLEQANENYTIEQNSSAKAKQDNTRKKKQTSKVKAKKVPKLDVPGSAKRLKIKEKAVLSDVFSKYGSKAALASKDS